MTDAKFSPGPWSPGCFVHGEAGCQCRGIFDEGHAGGIATVAMWNGISGISNGDNDAPKRDEAMANAYLIAAAPDLYAALEAFVANEEKTEDDEQGYAADSDILVNARIALSKARSQPIPEGGEK